MNVVLSSGIMAHRFSIFYNVANLIISHTPVMEKNVIVKLLYITDFRRDF